MTARFSVTDAAATLAVNVEGYTVTVIVEPRPGKRISAEDAEVILTSALPEFPQRARFPEMLRR